MNEMTDRFQGALAKVNLYCQDLDREVRERTRQVIQNEQLASVGFLAAGVAHEINNPPGPRLLGVPNRSLRGSAS